VFRATADYRIENGNDRVLGLTPLQEGRSVPPAVRVSITPQP